MKNTRFHIAAMAVAMLFVTSCQKESLVRQEFSARMEADASDAKTTLVGNVLQWQRGSDQVSITSIATTTENSQTTTSVTTSTFTAEENTNYPNDYSYAFLSLNQGETELAESTNNTDVTYRAIYPAGAARENNTKIVLPKTQESTSGELTGYPMYAESSSKSLQFKNLCSVLKLSLKGSGTINKIELVTDQYINGTFTVSNPANTTTPLTRETYNENDVQHSAIGDHTKVTTLTMSSPVTLSSTAQYFYIYLPVQEYNYIRINIYKTDGNIYTKTRTTAFTPERSKYHLIEFDDVAFVSGLLNGVFTVAAGSGSTPARKVSFARGNLLSNSANSTSYRFADNQYDLSATGNTNYLFNWAGYNGNTEISSSTTMNQRNTNISNADNNTTWNVLTQQEWKYLLSRPGYGGRSVNYHHWTLVSVTKANNSTVVHGMIIFPDVFYWPLEYNKQPSIFDESSVFYGHTWTGSGDNVLPTYSYEEWCKLESAGCVFLPITGMKSGSSNSISNSDYGYYWSRSPKNTSGNSSAKYTYFYYAGATFSTSNHFGITSDLAIRHVKYL